MDSRSLLKWQYWQTHPQMLGGVLMAGVLGACSPWILDSAAQPMASVQTSVPLVVQSGNETPAPSALVATAENSRNSPVSAPESRIQQVGFKEILGTVRQPFRRKRDVQNGVDPFISVEAAEQNTSHKTSTSGETALETEEQIAATAFDPAESFDAAFTESLITPDDVRARPAEQVTAPRRVQSPKSSEPSKVTDASAPENRRRLLAHRRETPVVVPGPDLSAEIDFEQAQSAGMTQAENPFEFDDEPAQDVSTESVEIAEAPFAAVASPAAELEPPSLIEEQTPGQPDAQTLREMFESQSVQELSREVRAQRKPAVPPPPVEAEIALSTPDMASGSALQHKQLLASSLMRRAVMAEREERFEQARELALRAQVLVDTGDATFTEEETSPERFLTQLIERQSPQFVATKEQRLAPVTAVPTRVVTDQIAPLPLTELQLSQLPESPVVVQPPWPNSGVKIIPRVTRRATSVNSFPLPKIAGADPLADSLAESVPLTAAEIPLVQANSAVARPLAQPLVRANRSLSLDEFTTPVVQANQASAVQAPPTTAVSHETQKSPAQPVRVSPLPSPQLLPTVNEAVPLAPEAKSARDTEQATIHRVQEIPAGPQLGDQAGPSISWAAFNTDVAASSVALPGPVVEVRPTAPQSLPEPSTLAEATPVADQSHDWPVWIAAACCGLGTIGWLVLSVFGRVDKVPAKQPVLARIKIRAE